MKFNVTRCNTMVSWIIIIVVVVNQGFPLICTKLSIRRRPTVIDGSEPHVIISLSMSDRRSLAIKSRPVFSETIV